MSETFDALMIRKAEGTEGQVVEPVTLRQEDLMPGDTLVAVEHSTVNYKDGLAITGRAPVVRRFPMIPGVDFAGRVLRCDTGAFRPGERVVLNGFGVGEVHYGGYASLAQVKAEWLIPLPEGFTTADAMAIGTAGYTAALAVLALEKSGVRPDDGDVLVTGAAGGVGSIAIALLHRRGYRVVASSRRAEAERDFLTGLGADEVIEAAAFAAPGRPLGKERWAGAIDSVGSHTLATVLSQTRYRGVVAACGLAQGADLPATVMPFILRGVTLKGIDSVMAPRKDRTEAWALLRDHLSSTDLGELSRTVPLSEVPEIAEAIVGGKVRGRVVVQIPETD